MWLQHFTTDILNRLTVPRARPVAAGLTLGWTVESPHRRVVFADKHRCEHAVVLGKTGSGKTHFLEVMALALAQKGEGFALIDFHGDVSASLISRLNRLDNSGRLVILDPSHPTLSAGLNVLEADQGEAGRFRKVSEISAILRQRWGVDSFGARTEELLRNSLYTLAANGLALTDLPRLLTDAEFRATLMGHLPEGDIRDYWSDRYEPLSDAMKGAFREPLLNRVTGFLTEPAARHLLGQRRSTIDFNAVIERQQWLIVRLPKGRLREHAHTLGNLVFAQLQFAVLARERLPPQARRTFTLLADEAQNLQENDIGTLLTEGRKFGISVVTANQFWEQMPRELRGALLSANSLVCFRLSHSDATVLASELSANRRQHVVGELTGLPRGEAIGRFAQEGLAHFRVPPLPATPVLRVGEMDALVGLTAQPREQIEAQIAATRVRHQEPVRVARRRVPEGHDDW